jgi:siderophore synthetase component
MKDIGEEVAILNGSAPLPGRVAQLAVSLEEEMKLNYILLDIFDCIFRFMAPLLDSHTSLSEQGFWSLVAGKVRDYQASHPQFADKYHRYDLFQPTFVRTCLNRIQLNNNQQMIDLEDREKNLRFAGDIDNPLHPFAVSHSFGMTSTQAERLADPVL